MWGLGLGEVCDALLLLYVGPFLVVEVLMLLSLPVLWLALLMGFRTNRPGLRDRVRLRGLVLLLWARGGCRTALREWIVWIGPWRGK